mmetsp:Transcript_129295/g.374390  ORF Transcript_129295/g.374390 Transcript_129295/m.374390 type:complete len:359 (-) Transcript_129295:1137-2213(-)
MGLAPVDRRGPGRLGGPLQGRRLLGPCARGCYPGDDRRQPRSPHRGVLGPSVEGCRLGPRELDDVERWQSRAVGLSEVVAPGGGTRSRKRARVGVACESDDGSHTAGVGRPERALDRRRAASCGGLGQALAHRRRDSQAVCRGGGARRIRGPLVPAPPGVGPVAAEGGAPRSVADDLACPQLRALGARGLLGERAALHVRRAHGVGRPRRRRRRRHPRRCGRVADDRHARHPFSRRSPGAQREVLLRRRFGCGGVSRHLRDAGLGGDMRSLADGRWRDGRKGRRGSRCARGSFGSSSRPAPRPCYQRGSLRRSARCDVRRLRFGHRRREVLQLEPLARQAPRLDQVAGVCGAAVWHVR